MLTLTVDQKDQLLKNFQAYVEHKNLADITFHEGTPYGEFCYVLGYRYQAYILCLYISKRNKDSYSISLQLMYNFNTIFRKEFTDLTYTQILGLFTADCPIATNILIQDYFKA